MYLLTTYTHHSELQVIYSSTANFHDSQITTASAKFYQPALSSPAVPGSGF
jgi:hypothetical protein